jgi:sulfite reductase (ferredoxin)
MVKRHNGRSVPYYELVAGGLVKDGGTKFAEKIEALPAKAIPDLLYDFLLHSLQAKNTTESFSDFLVRAGIQQLKELVATYTAVPTFEENESYYFDWYSEEPFSPAGKSSGESQKSQR